MRVSGARLAITRAERQQPSLFIRFRSPVLVGDVNLHHGIVTSTQSAQYVLPDIRDTSWYLYIVY